MYYLIRNMYDSPPQNSLYLWRESKKGLFMKLGKRWHKSNANTMDEHLSEYLNKHILVAKHKYVGQLLKIKILMERI